MGSYKDIAFRTTTAFVFRDITNSDSTTYEPEVLRGLLVKTTGNIVLVDHEGNSTTVPVTAGQRLDLAPRKVMSTGSTATVIGLFQ